MNVNHILSRKGHDVFTIEPTATLGAAVKMLAENRIGAFAIPGEEGQSIAWQAHTGGFFVGLLLFSLFDPIPPARPDPTDV